MKTHRIFGVNKTKDQGVGLVRPQIQAKSNQIADTYIANQEELNKNLQLIYMDPYMTVFRRKGSITKEQQQRLTHFYKTFWPGKLDVQAFDRENQAKQYLLLWFSAEITGNNGQQYLDTAKKYAPANYISLFREKMSPLIEHGKLIQ